MYSSTADTDQAPIFSFVQMSFPRARKESGALTLESALPDLTVSSPMAVSNAVQGLRNQYRTESVSVPHFLKGGTTAFEAGFNMKAWKNGFQNADMDGESKDHHLDVLFDCAKRFRESDSQADDVKQAVLDTITDRDEREKVKGDPQMLEEILSFRNAWDISQMTNLAYRAVKVGSTDGAGDTRKAKPLHSIRQWLPPSIVPVATEMIALKTILDYDPYTLWGMAKFGKSQGTRLSADLQRVLDAYPDATWRELIEMRQRKILEVPSNWSSARQGKEELLESMSEPSDAETL